MPDRPGLGIQVDVGKLAGFGEKYSEMAWRGLAVKRIREKGLFTALRLSRRHSR